MCFSTDPAEPGSISHHDATCLIEEIEALTRQRDAALTQLRYLCECDEHGLRPSTLQARQVLREAVE